MNEKGIIKVPVMKVQEPNIQKAINNNDIQPPITFYDQDKDDEHLKIKDDLINQRNKKLHNEQRRLNIKDVYNDELNPMAEFNRQLSSLHQNSEQVYGKVNNKLN